MDDLNFPKKKQRDFLLLSTFIFVLIALFLRFLINTQETLMMRHFDIGYLYHPFGNLFGRPAPGNWSDWKIIYVFSIGPATGFLLGMYLLRVLIKNTWLAWRPRLMVTWFTFFLLNAFPMGMLIGVFLYSDFGYAFSNMFISAYIRLAISVLAVALAIFFRPFWLHMFIKTAPGHRYAAQQSTYLKVIFIRPWIFGTLIIAAFSLIGGYWAWLLSVVTLGLVVLPILNWTKPKVKVKLTRSRSKNPFESKVAYYTYITLILGLFIFALFWRFA